jgi:hypothetical protein
MGEYGDGKRRRPPGLWDLSRSSDFPFTGTSTAQISSSGAVPMSDSGGHKNQDSAQTNGSHSNGGADDACPMEIPRLPSEESHLLEKRIHAWRKQSTGFDESFKEHGNQEARARDSQVNCLCVMIIISTISFDQHDHPSETIVMAAAAATMASLTW